MLLIALCLALPLHMPAQDNFGGGSGEREDPYLISTKAHLDSLSNRVYRGNNYAGKHFAMTADLDYQGKNLFPIGVVNSRFTDTPYHPFSGIFSGRGHSIVNVVVNLSECSGIFGYIVDGSVSDLTVGGNSTFYGTRSMGAIAGSMHGGTISNCSVGSGVNIVVTGGDPIAVGGIVGMVKYGTVRQCVNGAAIDLNNYSQAQTVGGITGAATERGNVIECFNFGEIKDISYTARYIGSVVGFMSPNDDCFVQQNFHGGPAAARGGLGNENDNRGTDVEGTAEAAYSLTFDNNVSHRILSNGNRHYNQPQTSPLITFNNEDYYRSNAEITMKLWCDDGVTPGYIGRSTFVASRSTLTEAGDSTFTLTLSNNCVVRLSSHNVVRDINHSDWFSISVPPVEYTGEPISPAVTVIDIKDGNEVTLVEGTDFVIVEPESPLLATGHHTFHIQGINNFGNKTAATLLITSPAGTWAGNGTSHAPYLIASVEDMDLLANNVNNGIGYDGTYFSLVEDLDYQGKTYTPIGNASNQFNGNFNGNGHAVDNVVINLPDDGYKGLFGNTGSSAVVSGITLGGNSSITAKNYLGGIVGLNNGTVTDCHTAEGVTIHGFQNVGGIAGYNQAAVNHCTNRAIIGSTGRTLFDDKSHGGIAGYNYNGTILKCANYGAISGGTYQAGGIAGCNQADIDSCLNMAAVNGNQQTGGIAGATRNGKISNNLNLGAVECYKNLKGSITGENIETELSNNYYYGSDDAFGAVKNTDIDGQAQRAFRIFAPGDTIGLERQGNSTVGLLHDKAWYIGAGQSISLLYNYTVPSGYLIDCFTHNGNNAGTAKTHNLTTTEDIEVGVSLKVFNCPWIGEGTIESPYLITSVEKLDKLATFVNEGTDFGNNHFSLTTDLDYSGLPFTPIGNASCLFNGNFSGNGHAVDNVVINLPDEDCKGLFGNIGSSAVVSGITLGGNSSITAKSRVGGIAGLNNGTVTDCHTAEGVTVYGFQNVGGIAGYNQAAVNHSTNRATIGSTGRTIIDDSSHGGIAGYNYKGTIEHCVNYGDINGGTYIAGGIAGNSQQATINLCVNVARVSGNQQVGGITGVSVSGKLSNSLNIGVVECVKSLRGSIIGENLRTQMSNNYYYGSSDAFGAVQNNDIDGQAQRAFRISAADEAIGIVRTSTGRGIGFDNACYIGLNQYVTVRYDYTPAEGYLFSSFTHNGNDVGADDTRTISTEEDILVGVLLQEPKNIVISDDYRHNGYYVSTYHDADHNLIVPQGIEARTYWVNNGNLTVSRTYHPLDIIPADEAVVLFAQEPASYSFGLSGDCHNDNDELNMLRGITGGGTDDEAGYRYYVLAYDNSSAAAPAYVPQSTETLGFYRLDGQGLSVEVPANTAYLKVPDTEDTGAVGYPFTRAETTGITVISPEPKPTDDGLWYTISGQQLHGRPTEPGIYIHNRQKVVVK